jgi:hypothetical protein
MDIFWMIVGALLAAWKWVCDIMASVSFTNVLLLLLILRVNDIYNAYFHFESAKERARKK